MKLAILLFLISFSAFSADIGLKDYDWTLSDVLSRGLSKEVLFKRMDRNFVKVDESICSNRAHMWVHSFKTKFNIDSGKIFLFYTNKREDLSKTWWYHVAPVINEGGNLWVMDPLRSTPNSKDQWLTYFVKTSKCKEINANETELIELIFNGQVFPKRTIYGNHECYYKIVPHTLWTPQIVALNLLGKDRNGKPVRVERPYISQNELLQACLEATTTKVGYVLGKNKKECREYVGLPADR